MSTDVDGRHAHPAWLSLLGTTIGYGLLLLLLFALLFLLPYILVMIV